MKKLLGLCLVLGLIGCVSNQTTSTPNIIKNEFDGSKAITFKPSNIVCTYSNCPNLGFSWNSKMKDVIGVTIVTPNQIKYVHEISFNIDGDISSFSTKDIGTIQLMRKSEYSSQTILVPVKVLEKTKNAKVVKVQISGPSFVQDGSLMRKDGDKVVAFRNLIQLLNQIEQ